MKRQFTATFSNGTTISRKSERSYEYAYFVPVVTLWEDEIKVDTESKGQTGFAATYELAEKAARSYLHRTQEVPRGRQTATSLAWYKKDWAKNKDRYAAANKLKIAGIEIVKTKVI